MPGHPSLSPTAMTPACLKKLVTVSVAGRKLEKLQVSSPPLVRSWGPRRRRSVQAGRRSRGSGDSDGGGRDEREAGRARETRGLNVVPSPASRGRTVPSPVAPPLARQPRLLTSLGVRVAVRLAGAAHDVGQVNGGPGEGHAVAAQAGAELLGCQAQLLQLLFVLWGDPPPSPRGLSAPGLPNPGSALPGDPFATLLSLHLLTLAASTSFITMYGSQHSLMSPCCNTFSSWGAGRASEALLGPQSPTPFPPGPLTGPQTLHPARTFAPTPPMVPTVLGIEQELACPTSCPSPCFEPTPNPRLHNFPTFILLLV